ncbi:MAG: response regulator [Actinomycetota bacterium]|nr:response regulator [Acidimicrobiia bacterium]MDQ3294509.1 response regulator [Actinomycetota bacterium]
MIGTFIVDDEADLRLLVRLAIERRNEGLFVAGEAAHGEEALAQLDAVDPTVVVLDQMMPGMDGLETASHILARRPGQLIILYSAFLDEKLEEQASRTGITACMRKGKVSELADFVHQVASGAP